MKERLVVFFRGFFAVLKIWIQIIKLCWFENWCLYFINCIVCCDTSVNLHQLTSFFFQDMSVVSNYPFEILFVACCNCTLHIHFVKFPIELRNCALCSQTPSCVCCFKRAVKAGPLCSKCKLDIANCTYSWWARSVNADFWSEMCLPSLCLDRALSPSSDVLHYWQG